MKSVLPNRPGRVLAMLGFFVVAATFGWSGEKRVYVQYQSGAKGPVMAALASAGGRVHYEFDHLEAVAVSLPEQALNGIGRNPHVTLVEEDPIRVMSAQSVPYGIDMVQARDVWDSDRDGNFDAGAPTGEGVTIGVIDSGVYTGHEDLVGLNITGEPTISPGHANNWNRDFLSHGTHVVGTIIAANNTKGVIGVAPGVSRIHMVKVFSDTGTWINSSSLLAAVQAARNAGSDIISMSLSGDIQSRTEKKGMDQLYNQGVLLVAASGNDGNTRTAYPAGYASVIAVAAIDSNKVVADFSQKNSAVELAAPGVGVMSTISYIDETTLTLNGNSIPAIHVEFSAVNVSGTGMLVDGGLATATNTAAWSGNVVLVQRGSNSFAEKVMNVQASGGVACVIYNNTAGELFATLGDGNTSSIPAVGITQADGEALIANSLGESASVSNAFTPPHASGYQAWDGTSMATPHVSGVAALVWSAFPQASNAQIRQALVSTAEDLGALGRDNSYGYGLVRAKAAIDYLGGSNPPPPDDDDPPVISDLQTASAKGKKGTFAITFATNEPATAVVAVYSGGNLIGSATTSLGTSHSVKVQGAVGQTYSGTVVATDAAGNPSATVQWIHEN